MDKHKTMVVFRIWKDNGDCIALMPMDRYNDLCNSYEHIGQHGAASYLIVMKQTRPAKPEECIDLADELRDIGYNLEVRQRRPGYRYALRWHNMGNS